MSWLTDYSAAAALSDRLVEHPKHTLLLAAGLMGEAGSVVAEIKKKERETTAYPVYRQRLSEELGDFLWYYVRLADTLDSKLLAELSVSPASSETTDGSVESSVEFVIAVSDLLRVVQDKELRGLKERLSQLWAKLKAVSSLGHVDLVEAARANLKKTQSRWPEKKEFASLFDENLPAEEQLPRTMTLEFVERKRGARTEVILRANGINVGDRITDNIADSDAYRYHDIFHVAHAVFLGWSPIVRSLLRCKRKSIPQMDENEDGARAGIIEEAVSAIVFSRAKNMNCFENLAQIDYDLLKSIQEFVEGYEVSRVPVWQWELAIREGYRVFRLLRDHAGGRIFWDLTERRLEWLGEAS